MRMIFAFLALAAQTPPTLQGNWTNARGSVVVLIAPCEGQELLCGTVQSASDKAKDDARKAGTAELVGVELFRDFVPRGQDRWTGVLFVPDLKKRSQAEIVRLDDDHLRVRGCVIGKLLCKSQIWSRVRD